METITSYQAVIGTNGGGAISVTTDNYNEDSIIIQDPANFAAVCTMLQTGKCKYQNLNGNHEFSIEG